MPTPELTSVRDAIAWSYANLACAHSALKAGRTKHAQLDWMIRAKLFRGLRTGAMSMRSLFDDERLKMIEQPLCVYCGSDGPLSIDHLIPRAVGGWDRSENLVRACRPCNSSKGKRDVLTWHIGRGSFPSILTLRRYLKIVAEITEQEGLTECSLDDERLARLPFDLTTLPFQFPPLSDLRL